MTPSEILEIQNLAGIITEALTITPEDLADQSEDQALRLDKIITVCEDYIKIDTGISQAMYDNVDVILTQEQKNRNINNAKAIKALKIELKNTIPKMNL